MELNEKVVILTGASEGIGLATVRLFAQQGALVALVARSTEKARREMHCSSCIPRSLRLLPSARSPQWEVGVIREADALSRSHLFT